MLFFFQSELAFNILWEDHPLHVVISFEFIVLFHLYLSFEAYWIGCHIKYNFFFLLTCDMFCVQKKFTPILAWNYSLLWIYGSILNSKMCMLICSLFNVIFCIVKSMLEVGYRLIDCLLACFFLLLLLLSSKSCLI